MTYFEIYFEAKGWKLACSYVKNIKIDKRSLIELFCHLIKWYTLSVSVKGKERYVERCEWNFNWIVYFSSGVCERIEGQWYPAWQVGTCRNQSGKIIEIQVFTCTSGWHSVFKFYSGIWWLIKLLKSCTYIVLKVISQSFLLKYL